MYGNILNYYRKFLLKIVFKESLNLKPLCLHTKAVKQRQHFHRILSLRYDLKYVRALNM